MSDEKLKYVARIALRAQAEKTLENWKIHLQEVFPTFEPSSSALASWAIERSPILSKKEIETIKSQLFDDVKELETLLLRLKKAKSTGDEREIKGLLSTVSIRRKPSPQPSAPTATKLTPKSRLFGETK